MRARDEEGLPRAKAASQWRHREGWVMGLDIVERGIVAAAIEHAAKSRHHPACLCTREPDIGCNCSCHVEKARKAQGILKRHSWRVSDSFCQDCCTE